MLYTAKNHLLISRKKNLFEEKCLKTRHYFVGRITRYVMIFCKLYSNLAIVTVCNFYPSTIIIG